MFKILTPTDGAKFAGYIFGRSAPDVALGYLDRIIDRIINKARGVITFNSIGNATVALLIRVPNLTQDSKITMYISFLSLAASSALLLLTMFGGFFGNPDDYAQIQKECNDTSALIMRRANILQFAIILSVLGFTIATLDLGLYVFE